MGGELVEEQEWKAALCGFAAPTRHGGSAPHESCEFSKYSEVRKQLLRFGGFFGLHDKEDGYFEKHAQICVMRDWLDEKNHLLR